MADPMGNPHKSIAMLTVLVPRPTCITGFGGYSLEGNERIFCCLGCLLRCPHESTIEHATYCTYETCAPCACTLHEFGDSGYLCSDMKGLPAMVFLFYPTSCLSSPISLPPFFHADRVHVRRVLSCCSSPKGL